MKKVLESWIGRKDIRPYVYMRRANYPKRPGSVHRFEFPRSKILHLDPSLMDQGDFALQVLRLENKAFEKIGLTLPRWALFDCYVMPGLVCGFAMHRDSLTESMKSVLTPLPSLEWIPISLFIAIPTNEKDHWVANNLCSINSLIPESETLRSLGFLTKAFGLWFSNIKYLYGMTQWNNAAIKVHANYGRFELVSAYTPIHSIATTLTYRVKVDARYWKAFMQGETLQDRSLKPAGILLRTENTGDIMDLQRALELGKKRFFLSSADIAHRGTREYEIFHASRQL